MANSSSPVHLLCLMAHYLRFQGSLCSCRNSNLYTFSVSIPYGSQYNALISLTTPAFSCLLPTRFNYLPLPRYFSPRILVPQGPTLLHSSTPAWTSSTNSSSDMPNTFVQTYSVCSPRQGAGRYARAGVSDRLMLVPKWVNNPISL
jgi:hypothetical protein